MGDQRARIQYAGALEHLDRGDAETLPGRLRLVDGLRRVEVDAEIFGARDFRSTEEVFLCHRVRRVRS